MSVPLTVLPSSHGASELVLALVAAPEDAAPYPAGSAVVIAPGLALTATHVLDGFWQHFGGSEELPAGFGVQAIQYIPGQSQPAIWHVPAAVQADGMDIAVLALAPAANVPHNYNPLVPTLDVSQPSPGMKVQAFGFPKSEVEQEGTGWVVRHLAGGAVGVVGQVFPHHRDSGMLNFPCYEMSLPILSGMSGGPVFDENGRLRGVICSSVEPNYVPSYASTLWPSMGLRHPAILTPAPTLLELSKVGLVKAINVDDLVIKP